MPKPTFATTYAYVLNLLNNPPKYLKESPHWAEYREVILKIQPPATDTQGDYHQFLEQIVSLNFCKALGLDPKAGNSSVHFNFLSLVPNKVRVIKVPTTLTAPPIITSEVTASTAPSTIKGKDTTVDCKNAIAAHFTGTSYASDKQWKRTSKQKVGSNVVRTFVSTDGAKSITVLYNPTTNELTVTESASVTVTPSPKSTVDFAADEDMASEYVYLPGDCYFGIVDDTAYITPVWFWDKYKHLADFIGGHSFSPGVLTAAGCDDRESMEAAFTTYADYATSKASMIAAGFIYKKALEKSLE